MQTKRLCLNSVFTDQKWREFIVLMHLIYMKNNQIFSIWPRDHQFGQSPMNWLVRPYTSLMLAEQYNSQASRDVINLNTHKADDLLFSLLWTFDKLNILWIATREIHTS